MVRASLPILLVLLVVTSSTPAQSCGTPGTGGLVPKLGLPSNLWDSSGTFEVRDGLSGAPWIWAIDQTPGPYTAPFGNLCLGFTPGLFILFDAVSGGAPPLDVNGSFTLPVSFAPSTAPLLGVPFYNQGVVLDPAAALGIAITTEATFQMAAPKVVITNVNVAARSFDVVDGYAMLAAPPTALLDTVSNQNHDDLVISPDGRYVYTRDITYLVTDRVRCWDVTVQPAAMIGELQVLCGGTPCPGLGVPRRGIDLDSTGTVGFFCDQGGIYRFDADPTSPTFMTTTGFAVTTVPSPESLRMSADDQLVFVSNIALIGSVPSFLTVIDATGMQEVATVPLTDVGNFLGLTQRGPVAVSPDGRFAATLSMGIYLPGFSTAQSVLGIVDVDPASPGFLTEIAAITLPRFYQDDLAFDPRDPNGFTVYTVDSEQPAADIHLTTIDWSTSAISGTLLLAGASGNLYAEGGVATTPDGDYLYVALQADSTLRILDAATQSVINTLFLASNGDPNRVYVERRR